MIQNIINFNNKVIDKFVSRKENITESLDN